MNKLQALEDMKCQLAVVLAKGRCKNITKQEVYALVDEIFEFSMYNSVGVGLEILTPNSSST